MGVRWEAYTGNEITNGYIYKMGQKVGICGQDTGTPFEFYGKARRSFKIGMITTVDPSEGEDMYADSTDVESPRLEGPQGEESEKEEKEEEYGED